MVLCSRESERFINAGRHFLSPPRVRRDQSNPPGRAPVLPLGAAERYVAVAAERLH